MKKIFILLFFCLSAGSNGQDWRMKWQQSGTTWRDKWMSTFDALDSYSETERFEILGAAVRAASSSRNPGGEEIVSRARDLLVAIPGHAEYFANGIKRERAAATSPEEVASRDGAISWANYNRVRWDAFETLKHLPSVETVRVLGGFLGDEENPDELRPDDGTNDTIGPGTNSGLAIFALRPLLQDDPVKSEKPYLESGEREAWQQWYEQVKAGHRTFRLEGDPTEYDLAGPASKEQLSLIERDQKRDDERATGQRKSSAVPVTVEVAVQSRKPSTIIAILAGFALIVGAIWYFLRSRRTA